MSMDEEALRRIKQPLKEEKIKNSLVLNGLKKAPLNTHGQEVVHPRDENVL